MSVDTGGCCDDVVLISFKQHTFGGKNIGQGKILLGKTWLDSCAFAAMQAMITFYGTEASQQPEFKILSERSYEIAQAMLKEKRRLENIK
jgi:hypothetical protein